METPGRRPGRRPGKQDTGAAILAAARDVFAERGFDRASIRAIAARAGVDPALVHHYFGSKQELFMAVVQPPIDPNTLIPRLLDAGLRSGPDGVGQRFVRTFLSLLDETESGSALRGLIRSAVTDETSARLVREFFATQVIRQVLENVRGAIPAEQVPRRASLVASQLVGLVVVRYLVELEPLASMSVEDVVSAVAPTMDRYFLGDLGPDLPGCGDAVPGAWPTSDGADADPGSAPGAPTSPSA